jgi:putative ABC transport system permease protein
LFDILTLALQNIKRRALRNALTVTGLAVFVLIFIMVSSLTLSMQRSLAESMSDLGGEIMVWDDDALVPFLSTIPENYTATVENISHVERVVPQITGVSRVDLEDFRLTIGIAPSDLPFIYSYSMTEGVVISSNETSAAVGCLFADFLKKHAGDNITIDGHTLPLIGIYKTDTWVDNAVIVPFTTAQEIFGLKGRTSIITVIVSDPAEIDSVMSEIRREIPDVGVYKSQEATDRLTPLINSVSWVSLALFTIAGIACFFGIMNVVMTGVFERTREIGIMKAIGAQGTDVMKIILYESTALGTLGGLLGCLISLTLLAQGLAIPVTSTTSFQIPIILEVFLQGLAFSVSISILATLYPVWKAVKVRPNEVLRFG